MLKHSSHLGTVAGPCRLSLLLPAKGMHPFNVKKHGLATRSQNSRSLDVRAASNPVREAISGLATNIYKATALFAPVEPGTSPMWASILKLDSTGMSLCMKNGANANERGPTGETPLLYISREGHYKYPPQEIPKMLIDMGADLEQRNAQDLTALEVSLLSGWQNIAGGLLVLLYEDMLQDKELLLKAGASTSGVPSIAPRVTCPDCKRLIAQYNLA
ncbi:hypothetical protein DUNSADRAFT_10851 [Dunaliella salina]|uniref:Uncharacterized protein n=1 Tax=Dunaliella salina TaxID=3046 RepID=A0ABQ7H9Z2_DUNSA|nr:hypothetical protein DUNSADRAFT_10851 [Dunaliella salina]|eukprot:KAF5843676.1 hypothetical protein DUNSADRAFT_10851 [Dunaliella salina]